MSTQQHFLLSILLCFFLSEERNYIKKEVLRNNAREDISPVRQV